MVWCNSRVLIGSAALWNLLRVFSTITKLFAGWSASAYGLASVVFANNKTTPNDAKRIEILFLLIGHSINRTCTLNYTSSNSVIIWPHQLTLIWASKQLKKDTTQVSLTGSAIFLINAKHFKTFTSKHTQLKSYTVYIITHVLAIIVASIMT